MAGISQLAKEEPQVPASHELQLESQVNNNHNMNQSSQSQDFNQSKESSQHEHYPQDNDHSEQNNNLDKSQLDNQSLAQSRVESVAEGGNAEGDGKITIFNFNPEGGVNDNEIITSPRSLQACQITGIQPRMLIKKKGIDIYKPLQYKSNLNQEGIQQLSENQEKRRLEKVETVKEVRERIISGNLTKEEQNILQDTTLLSSSQMLTQSKLEHKDHAGMTKSSFFPQETHFSWMSQETTAKLERTKYLQKREIESMIGEDLKMSLLYSIVDEKNSRYDDIEQKKAYFRSLNKSQVRRQQQNKDNQYEAILNEQKAQQRLEKHYQGIHQDNAILENEVDQKRIATEQNQHFFKETIKKVRNQEGQRKMMRTENAKRIIDEREEQRRSEAERQYNLKLDKLQQNQVIYTKYLHDRQKQMNENHNSRGGRVFSANMKKSQLMEAKNIERQNKADECAQKLRKDQEIKQRLLEAKITEKKNKENSIQKRKQDQIDELSRKTLDNFQKHFSSLTQKHDQLQADKQHYFMSVKSRKAIKELNIADNLKRMENIQESKNKIINDKLMQREIQQKAKLEEVAQAMKNREIAQTRLVMQKGQLKKELDFLFQKCRRVDTSHIGSKYNLQLDTEQNILSRSVADLDKMKHTSKQSFYQNQQSNHYLPLSTQGN